MAGRGGMGVVYRALQLDLDRTVALKLIAPTLALDDAFRERFVRESRAAAAIDHPNVVPVFSAGEHDGRLFLAMRYVEGQDLRSVVQALGPLDPERAARVVAQVAGALDAAHARGLVHRDVKPANVLLAADDHAYLTDFGLTKRLSEASVTGSGRWVGTLGYVAPEQIRADVPVDARADVYALGCVLYYALSAAAPFRRETDEATLWAHLHDAPPPLDDVAPGAPPALQDVLDRALAKDPADRYPSAGDLGRAALAAVGEGPAPGPERQVARGAAAPAGAADDETAVARTPPTPAGGEPHSDTPATRIAVARRAMGSWLGPVIALLAGAATVLVTVALLGGDDSDGGRSGSGTSATATTSTTASSAVRALRPVDVDDRPAGVALAGGRAWATGRRGRLRGVPLEGRGAVRSIALPDDRPASAIAAGLGSLWITQDGPDRLVRLDPRSGRVLGTVALPPGQPVAVAVLGRSVWVGRREQGGTPTDSVVKVDPASGEVTRDIIMGEEGVNTLDAGDGALFVSNRKRSRVTRIDASSGQRRSTAVGFRPRGVAVVGSSVYVAAYGENTVTRLSTDTLSGGAAIPVGQGPVGVAGAAGSVWVANYLEGTVTRIDARTGRVAARGVQVGTNPFAVAAGRRGAVVTNLADGTVQQVVGGS